MDTRAPATRAEQLRLFVALALPSEWRRYLARRAQDVERLAPGYARWVAPELLHLTLVFLGEQPAEGLPGIQAAVAEAVGEARTFRLALGGLGGFGGGAPRVLWVEARADGPALRSLHAALCQRLVARQIAFDRKPLAPHLTIGRARRDAAPAAGRALAGQLRTLALPAPPPPFEVESVALLRSELSAKGPRYTVLGEYALGWGGG